MIFYFSPGSSSLATHIALHEAGAEFEGRSMSVAKQETREADYLAVNPHGKVPALVIDGKLLTEVAGTLFYVARRYTDAQLLPPDDDIEAQAQVVSWMSFIASGIHTVWAQGPEVAMPAYELADTRLGDREWVVDSYSIADIHLFRLYWRFSNKFELPAGSLPNLKRHHDQMMQRPAVQKTLSIEAKMPPSLPL
ncbi:MAG: glutathione S-transferase N-terminal domain-containing protein [Pseudomonadota bacterium]